MLTKEEIAVVKDAWGSLMVYCSWEDMPPKLSEKVKKAAELLKKLEESAK